MKKFILFILFYSSVSIMAQNQDTIYLKNGNLIPCVIDVNGDVSVIYYQMVDGVKEKFKIKTSLVKNIYIGKEPEPITSDEKLNFSEVVNVDSSMKKNDLFINARAWVNKAFVSSKDVTQVIDKETGEILVKAIMNYTANTILGSCCISGPVSFSFNIYVKDGRYKYEVTNFIHTGTVSSGSPTSLGLITNSKEYPYKISWNSDGIGWYNNRWNEIKELINKKIPPLINDLKTDMQKPVKNDW